MEHVTPKQERNMQTARYTVENAKSITVRQDADWLYGEARTFVSLSWTNPDPDLGDDFISTGFDGIVACDEAVKLAAAEMEAGWQKSQRLAPRIDEIIAETGCDWDDAAERAYYEDEHNLLRCQRCGSESHDRCTTAP